MGSVFGIMITALESQPTEIEAEKEVTSEDSVPTHVKIINGSKLPSSQKELAMQTPFYVHWRRLNNLWFYLEWTVILMLVNMQ